MAQRTRPLLITVTLCAAWLLLGAMVQFGPGREVRLPGVDLDRALVIEGGASLPDVITPGDRIIAVADVAVDSPLALAHAAARAGDGPISVRVELTEREETLLLTPERLADELPPALRGDFTVVRVGDAEVEGDVGVEELGFWLAQQGNGGPTAVTVRYTDQLQGPMRTERPPPAITATLWFALLLLGAAGVTLLSQSALTRDERGTAFDLAATTTGGVAAAALTAAVLQPYSPPLLVLWALAAAVVWRATSLGQHLWRSRGEAALEPLSLLVVVGPAAIALAGVAFVGVGGGSAGLDPGWFALLEQLRYAVFGAVLVVHLGDITAHVAPERRPDLRGQISALSAAGIGVVGLIAAIARPDAVSAGLIEAALLGMVVTQWLGDLGVSAPTEGLVGRPSAGVVSPGGSGLMPALDRLHEYTGGRDALFAVGIHGEYVLVGVDDVNGDGDLEVRSAIAQEALAAALDMLALEGGMYPRHERMHGGDVVEDDMFAGFSERLHLAAAIPLRTFRNEDALNAFFVVFQDDDARDWDIGYLAERVSAHESSLLYNELSGIASAELLVSARRLEQRTPAAPSSDTAAMPAPRGTMPMTSVPAPTSAAPRPPQAEAAGGDDRWSRRLADELARAYPVDDPETLDDREWRALGFLVESDAPGLLVGEPGAGKEFIARAIHDRSSRAGRRFAVLDCALVPESLVEVELFGDDEEPGLVELVDDGTLLVKSLSRLDRTATNALVARLGRSRARILFAERYTGPEAGIPRDVAEAIRGAVDDRYLHLTPLRDRGADLIRYARYYLLRAAMRYDLDVVDFSADALEQLRHLPLRGNFAELVALVTTAALQSHDEVVEALPAMAVAGHDDPQGELELDLNAEEQAERDAILAALEQVDGNRTRAAEALKMTRGKLLRRIKKFGIE